MVRGLRIFLPLPFTRRPVSSILSERKSAKTNVERGRQNGISAFRKGCGKRNERHSRLRSRRRECVCDPAVVQHSRYERHDLCACFIDQTLKGGLT